MKCSRCTNERDKESQRYCRACRAWYQSQWRRKQKVKISTLENEVLRAKRKIERLERRKVK